MLKIGSRIREIRKAKKVTLIDLSKQTGIAQATLSRIETDQMVGTVESHQKIAETLGLSLAELYAPLDRRYQEIAISRKETPRKVTHQGKGCQIELLTQGITKKKITPLFVTLAGNARTALERNERGVEKFLWILEGEVEVSIEKENHTLKTGDTLYFDASLPHRISNPKGKSSKIFLAVSPSKI